MSVKIVMDGGPAYDDLFLDDGYVVNKTYSNVVSQSGGVPYWINSNECIDDYVEFADALIVSGGNSYTPNEELTASREERRNGLKEREEFDKHFSIAHLTSVNCRSVEEAEALLKRGIYLAVILYAPLWSISDLMTIVWNMRSISYIPIIVITKRKPILSVLRTGADMCCQPNSDIEWLCDHVMACIRRYTHYDCCKCLSQTASIIQHGELLIDPPHHRVLLSGTEIELQPREFRLLTYFARNPGVVLSTDQIYEAVWPAEQQYSRSVATVISELRKKLGDQKSQPTYIETVRGVGYRFIPDK